MLIAVPLENVMNCHVSAYSLNRQREGENFIRHSIETKNHTIQKFTSVAGCQKGHNTHRAGHLKKKQIESKIKSQHNAIETIQYN